MGVLEEEGEGGQQASCLVAKQAVEFPQVLSMLNTGSKVEGFRHDDLGRLWSLTALTTIK